MKENDIIYAKSKLTFENVFATNKDAYICENKKQIKKHKENMERDFKQSVIIGDYAEIYKLEFINSFLEKVEFDDINHTITELETEISHQRRTGHIPFVYSEISHRLEIESKRIIIEKLRNFHDSVLFNKTKNHIETI